MRNILQTLLATIMVAAAVFAVTMLFTWVAVVLGL